MSIKKAPQLRPISLPEMPTLLSSGKEYPTAYELVPFDASSLLDEEESDHA
jgi:hypothetical protein